MKSDKEIFHKNRGVERNKKPLRNNLEKEKLSSIIRHMKKVEDNCNILAHKLFDRDKNFAIELVNRGRSHDLSKLDSSEFNNLWVDSENFKIALDLHHSRNRHHPEYFYEYGIHMMRDIDIAEMVCDCLARSQEFGTSIHDWFFKIAPDKYNYKEGDPVWDKIKYYLDLILTTAF